MAVSTPQTSWLPATTSNSPLIAFVQSGAAVTSSSTRTVCDAPETEYGPIGPASDVWSLGATLVEVLTKYPPQWNRTRTAEPTVPESMPEPFASIARKCLRSDPARRITLDEIAARLDPAKAPSRPQEKPATDSHHRRRIALPIAIVALVLAGVGIWFALSHRAQPPQLPLRPLSKLRISRLQHRHRRQHRCPLQRRLRPLPRTKPQPQLLRKPRRRHQQLLRLRPQQKLRFRPPAQPQYLQPFRRLNPPIKPQRPRRPPRRRTISLPHPQP